jgi:hypothetical protein
MEKNLANDLLAAAIKDRTRLQYGNLVDAGYSIQLTGGRFARASSDNNLMFAIGSVSVGALVWMKHGGNREAYEAERARIFRSFTGGQLGSLVGTDFPDLESFGYFRAMKNNFDRGAATAIGLGLNSSSDENYNTLRRGIVTKINRGEYMGTNNRSYTPNFRGLLTSTGYNQSVNRNRSINKADTPQRSARVAF